MMLSAMPACYASSVHAAVGGLGRNKRKGEGIQFDVSLPGGGYAWREHIADRDVHHEWGCDGGGGEGGIPTLWRRHPGGWPAAAQKVGAA